MLQPLLFRPLGLWWVKQAFSHPVSIHSGTAKQTQVLLLPITSQYWWKYVSAKGFFSGFHRHVPLSKTLTPLRYRQSVVLSCGHRLNTEKACAHVCDCEVWWWNKSLNFNWWIIGTHIRSPEVQKETKTSPPSPPLCSCKRITCEICYVLVIMDMEH